MGANYIKAKFEEDNEAFKVRRLRDITEEQFKMACVAAMTEKQEIRCFAGIPSSNDFILWQGKKKGLVQVRSWSGMLSLFIVSEGGAWLTSSHIDGPGAEEVLEEAWRQFLRAKPFISKSFDKAFKTAEVDMWAKNNSEWARVTQKWFKLMEDYFEEVNEDGREGTDQEGQPDR